MKDRIISWIGSDFIQLGLSASLQSKYDCDLYAIVDTTDRLKSFFKKQEFANFTKIWFYHDHILKSKKPIDLKYLASFEEKYGVNLWLLAYNDRLFFGYNDYYRFSYEEILTIIEQECRLFENILDETKPDFLIMPMTSLRHNHLFYLICKAKGIKILMPTSVRLGGRYMISNQPDKFDIFAIRNNNFSSKTIEQLQDYLKSFIASKDSRKFSSSFLTSKSKLFKAALQFILFSKNENIKTHYTYYGRTKLRVLFYSVLYLLKKKYRTHFINKYFSHVLDEERFVFYPLQTEPERSLLIAAPFNTDQLKTIKDIAKSLSVNYKLYVKEHPTQIVREWRSATFYKEIMNLPNVKLLHPSISNEDIIKKSSLVITVGGTTGFEAAFYGKPTVTFVEALYSELKSVHTLQKTDELPTVISLALQKKIDTNELSKFIADLEKNSFEINMMELEVDINNQFFYGGFLVDVDIDMEKMKSFYKKFKGTFDQLATEHIKKIKQYREHLPIGTSNSK